MKKFFLNLLKPTSTNDDSARKEYILNILLAGIITINLFALIANAAYCYTPGEVCRSHYPSIITNSIILAIFLFLFYLSKKGRSVISANIFISAVLLICLFTTSKSGVHRPVMMLIYALIITMSGILINAAFAIVTTIIISLTLILISTNKIFVGAQTITWQMQDTIVAVTIIAMIAVITWLSNHEIEKSLKRARKSEAELKKERDSLEIKVDERTKELKAAQLKQLSQMGHFAELGKLASGIFHDLVNPLTAVSLNLEQLKNFDKNEINDVKIYLQQALAATRKMEDFVKSVKKQISMTDIKNYFSPAREIRDSLRILRYKTIDKDVSIITDIDSSLNIFGNPLKFSQIVTNLVSNSIDAFSEKTKEKNVNIRLSKKYDKIVLEVSDNGPGIPEQFQKHIFDPFFTTKTHNKGTGIGLTIVKETVENHFLGNIELGSDSNGTKIKVIIPALMNKETRNESDTN